MDLVDNIDKNKSGKIDFNEFLTAVRKKNELYAGEALREAFDFVDKDKTNYISKKELKVLLKTA
jgi:Ca2+-binding EF-hand superfamily protein